MIDDETVLKKLLSRLSEAAQLPVSVALWNTADIAEYLRRSRNRVTNDIVILPTFPKPIRLPVGDRAQALYKARDVVKWAESYASL